ncbi:hypothetical protein Peur_020665 [Populus x canadensis]
MIVATPKDLQLRRNHGGWPESPYSGGKTGTQSHLSTFLEYSYFMGNKQPRVLKSNVRLHYYHSCGSYVAHHSLCSSKTARHTCVLKTRTFTPSQSHRVFAGSVQRSNPPTNHFPIRWHQR